MAEGDMLPIALGAAVPLWMLNFQDVPYDDLQERFKELDKSNFCYRLEHVLHKGPKEGDSAKAFNDLAKSIAFMSFCPGGVSAFGNHWEARHPDLKYSCPDCRGTGFKDGSDEWCQRCKGDGVL